MIIIGSKHANFLFYLKVFVLFVMTLERKMKQKWKSYIYANLATSKTTTTTTNPLSSSSSAYLSLLGVRDFASNTPKRKEKERKEGKESL
jgi:hypothetical protein